MSIGAFKTRSESETTLAPESGRADITKKSTTVKSRSLYRSNVSRISSGAMVTIEAVSDAAVRSRREAQRRRDEQSVGNTAQNAQNLGGEPLPSNIRQRLESSFKANLGAVRVHSGTRAQTAARNLSARALTVGNNIFLGAGERTSDLSLMAHETTHVVQQQRGATAVQTLGAFQNDSNEREARRSSESVMRGESFNIQGRAGAMSIQRLGLSDILDGLAELAANVPGYTLLTVIIGRNPINMRVVERNFTNILRGFMGLIPGGEILFQVLNSYGVVERIGQWTSRQLDALGFNYEYIRRRFTTFTDSLGLRDILSPGNVWRRARDIFTEPIDRITNFVSRLISQAIVWLKETFMQPLSNFCREIPGYTLVTVLLGRDPFTNAAVPRTALNVVRAFAEFIPGGTEKVNQLVESRALERAYTWFIEETQARNLTWARVSGTFVAAWNSLRLEDILHPIDTLRRIVGMFRPLMSDLIGFAGAALMKLLELIFEAVMGAGGNRILAILKRARQTFMTIIRNPVGFLRNLIGAVGQGVRQFMTNILRHLRDGVIAWLTGPVARAGIQMPERWDARGIIWFVLQILGLTWDRVRQKLVRLMGERAVGMLEAGFQLVQDIRQRGLVQALRDRVTEFFGQLRDTALGGIRSFIQQRLVMAGITQLLSLLNPVGAVIQAIIKTYTTIEFFIQRINQILDLVESIVNSIAAIASGSIGQAANFVERTMARTIPVILDFLARFIGLGDVGGHVQRTIQGLQTGVDQMLDRAVDWIRMQVQRLGNAVRRGVARVIQWWRERRPFRSRSGSNHTLLFQGSETNARLYVRSTERPLAEYIAQFDVNIHGAIIARIITIQDEIERLRTRTVHHTSGRTEERLAQPSVDTGNQINTKLTELSAELAKLPDPSGQTGENLVMPPSRMTSSGQTHATNNPAAGLSGPSADGVEVEVKPLSINPGTLVGSSAAPSAFSPLLRKVRERAGTYVAGHLLGAHLYGPGNQVWNLVPITVAANNNMSARENRIQSLIFNENKVVSYKVTASYSSSTPGPKLAAEGFLPRQITFVAKTMKLNPSVSGDINEARRLPANWVDDSPISLAPVTSTPPLNDNLNVPNLNSATGADITAKGVSADFARAIVRHAREQSFQNLADFQSKMSNAEATQILRIPMAANWGNERKAQLEGYLRSGTNGATFITNAKNMSLRQFVARLAGIIPDEFARFVYPHARQAADLSTFRSVLDAEIARTEFTRYEPNQANITANAQTLAARLNPDLTWK